MTLKQSCCWSCRTTTWGMKLQKNSSVNSSLHPSQAGPGSPAQAVPSEVPVGAQGPMQSWLPPSTAALGRAEGWHTAADGPSPPCLPMPEAWNAAGPAATWVTALPVTLPAWGSHPLLPEKPHRAAQAVAVGTFHPTSSSVVPVEPACVPWWGGTVPHTAIASPVKACLCFLLQLHPQALLAAFLHGATGSQPPAL